MTKNEFIKELENRIKKYPDHSEIISYYYELIQDKMDSGMSEWEAVESLGSLDKIVRDIENEKEALRDEVIINNNTESTNKVEIKETTPAPKRLNGGKKFVYVLWILFTIWMCIASIITLIVAISFLVGTVAIMITASVLITESLALSGFQFGIGLFLFGAAIIAVHYARVLVSFIFREKKVWSRNIKKGLGGE